MVLVSGTPTSVAPPYVFGLFDSQKANGAVLACRVPETGDRSKGCRKRGQVEYRGNWADSGVGRVTKELADFAARVSGSNSGIFQEGVVSASSGEMLQGVSQPKFSKMNTFMKSTIRIDLPRKIIGLLFLFSGVSVSGGRATDRMPSARAPKRLSPKPG